MIKLLSADNTHMCVQMLNNPHDDILRDGPHHFLKLTVITDRGRCIRAHWFLLSGCCFKLVF